MSNLKARLHNKKYIVFFDLEATQFSHETIAIGAFKVEINKDLTIRKVYKGYKEYVVAHERIGKIVSELTGITEETISKEGVQFATMQERFRKYVKVPFEKVMFVAFGNNDMHILRSSLQHNMHSFKDDVKIMGNNFIDFSEIVGEFVRDDNGNLYSLINYLKVFGVTPEGEAHDPLYDAKNLMLLYKAFVDDKHLLAESYKKLLVKKSFNPYVAEKVMKKLLNGEDVTPSDLDTYIKEYVEKK